MCKGEREDTKGRLVIRSGNWQYSGQNKKEKREKNDVQNTTQITQTSLKTGGELRCSRILPIYHDMWKLEICKFQGFWCCYIKSTKTKHFVFQLDWKKSVIGENGFHTSIYNITSSWPWSFLGVIVIVVVVLTTK
jgi:hypothetical protein